MTMTIMPVELPDSSSIYDQYVRLQRDSITQARAIRHDALSRKLRLPVTPLVATTPPSSESLLPSHQLAKRTARGGSKISPSELRPHVPAEERIFSWDTPWARRHRKSIPLPPKLAKSTILTVLHGHTASTRTTYGAGILRFTQFCDEWAIPEEDRMPASYFLLSAFLSSMEGSVADGTARGYMSGVRAWHQFHHAPWFGDDGWVMMARAGVAKAGAHRRLKPRAPVSLEHLVVLRVRLFMIALIPTNLSPART